MKRFIFETNKGNYRIDTMDYTHAVSLLHEINPDLKIKTFTEHQGYIYCDDITVYFETSPNENIYNPTIPEFVELDFEEDFEKIKENLIEELENVISWDTPDEPYFEIDDVDFNYELRFRGM